jgi:formylglycine-generating enzyme required for sulfatase activity
MGSSAFETGRLANERQHPVTLTHDFLISATEVTQIQFANLMLYNPSYYSATGGGTNCGTNCPVEALSWYEAAAYANALSVEAELPECYECIGIAPAVNCDVSADYDNIYDCPGYRLPTEAEWEFAARAGTTTGTYNGDLDPTAEALSCPATPPFAPNAPLEPIAWYCVNSGETTHLVDRLSPNDWNLSDMLGNVFEWINDWYGDYAPGAATDPTGPEFGAERILRGGSYYSGAIEVRSAMRLRTAPDESYANVGFRVARTLR